jgi:hypothetical protein
MHAKIFLKLKDPRGESGGSKINLNKKKGQGQASHAQIANAFIHGRRTNADLKHSLQVATHLDFGPPPHRALVGPRRPPS